jgi:formyltetrahydrofolate deformylase
VGELVLTLSCPDRPGIVHAVSGFLAERDCNILDSQQYGSPRTATFFMRVHFDSPIDSELLRTDFTGTASRFAMEWALHDLDRQPNVLVLVSKAGHCLADLLYRWRSGYLPGRLAAVAANHRDLEPLATSYGVPFHHLPVDAGTRTAQEARILELVDETQAELVVLARYMQVLSPEFLDRVGVPIINIHHSFLPAFAGANPYRQAKERGVKLVGATAHYVTEELDAGPIIEQNVVRVTHRDDIDTLAQRGADVERLVLARAVQAHCEDRVLRHGDTTVVF